MGRPRKKPIYVIVAADVLGSISKDRVLDFDSAPDESLLEEFQCPLANEVLIALRKEMRVLTVSGTPDLFVTKCNIAATSAHNRNQLTPKTRRHIMPKQRRLVNFRMTVGGAFSSDAGSNEEAIRQLMNKGGTDWEALLKDVYEFIGIDEDDINVELVEDE